MSRLHFSTVYSPILFSHLVLYVCPCGNLRTRFWKIASAREIPHAYLEENASDVSTCQEREKATRATRDIYRALSELSDVNK